MTESPFPADWLPYVQELQRKVDGMRQAPIGPGPEKAMPAVDPSLGPVLLFSPHPDDESITGLLPLRLRMEEGRPVINVAVTLGSKQNRRAARAREVEAACRVLGFSCEHFFAMQKEPGRLLENYEGGCEGAEGLIGEVIALLERFRPSLVVYPHGGDRHPTHVAVARLLEAALLRYAAKAKSVLAVETECWQPMENANLVVEGSAVQVARLSEAIACHTGEVARNPFHVRQPVRMMENFFRAAETVKGYGAEGCGRVSFAELYCLYRYADGGKKPLHRSIFLTADQSAGVLFSQNCFFIF